MDEAFRLVIALSAAGLLLLGLELFMANGVMGIVGGVALIASVVIGFKDCDFEIGAIALLIHVTVISIGFLSLLTFAPQSPIARSFLHRAAHRRRMEEAAEESDQGQGND